MIFAHPCSGERIACQVHFVVMNQLEGIDGGSWKSHVVNLVGVVSGFGTTGAVIGGSFGGPLGAATGGFAGAHYCYDYHFY